MVFATEDQVRAHVVGMGYPESRIVSVKATVSKRRPKTSRYWDVTVDVSGGTLGRPVGAQESFTFLRSV